MEKTIINKHGSFTILFDDEDIDIWNRCSWRIWFRHRYDRDIFYVYATKAAFHREIMKKYNNIEGVLIDHKDHNTLDNRKCNLRICNISENAGNSKIRKKRKYSQYKCVSKDERIIKKPWYAQIKGKTIGYFENEIEAAEAYNKKAIEVYGEFAYLNKIEQ